MGMERREFIRRSLLTSGAVVAGGAGLAAVSGHPSAPPPPAGPTLTLTPQGELVAERTELPGLPPGDPAVRRGSPGRRWVMVIDLAACNGCGDCSESCNAMHHTPADRQWIRVFRMRDTSSAASYWFPRPCFHCDNPPCTRVCPVDATFKRQDGVVLIDNERCIGCRFCMAACPYSARVFNWGEPEAPDSTAAPVAYSPETGHPRRRGTVEKCDFCPEHLRAGRLPACASICDMGAIYFGDEVEDAVTNAKGETLRFTKLLRDRGAYRQFEDLGTEPRVYYLPPVNRRYPTPDESERRGTTVQEPA